jgi:hypothetical protein
MSRAISTPVPFRPARPRLRTAGKNAHLAATVALTRRRPSLVLLAMAYLSVVAATARTPLTILFGTLVVAYVAVQLFLAARHISTIGTSEP